MQCFKCGEEQAPGNVFCTKCGTRLSAPQIPAIGPGETPPPPLTVSPTAHDEEQRILKELKEALKGVEGQKETAPPPPTLFGDLKKKAWLTGTFLLVLLIAGISLLLIVKNRETPVPEFPPPETTPSEETPPPVISNPVPSVDESTRITIGKMAAVLEAISNFTNSKKILPPTLIAVNRAYADPGVLQDGWGQNFLYLVDLTNKTYVLSSAGPDGKRGSPDDLSVISEEVANWLKQNEVVIGEWKSVNPNLYAQLANTGPTSTEAKKSDMAAKQEQERKRAAEAKSQAKIQAEAEQERKRLMAARLEEEKKQSETKRREEEQRQAKAREDALREKLAAKKPDMVKDNFSDGLAQWDAPSTWEIIQEKDFSALKLQGLGFLKKGEKWDNYKIEFEIKVSKESAGWVIRAKDSQSFYLFKLSSDKAKAVPKNSLIRYIRSDDKYLNSLMREDAPGAASVIPLPFKVKNKDYYEVTVTVRGKTITHSIDGTEVDVWSDDTFDHGRFGFNASVIESATIRNFLLEPLRK
jgi:flagellar motor protein MotB